MSFHAQIEAKLFPTQEALGDAIGLSKGQVAKMLKAAQLMRQPTLSQLFVDKSTVPVDQAYKLATLLERPGAKEVILQAAQNLARKGQRAAPRRHLRLSACRRQPRWRRPTLPT